MSFTIRPFNPATDFPALERIRTEANRIDHDIQTANSLPLTLVAVEDHRVIGYGATWHNPYWPPGELYVTVAVAPAWRRRGAGAALYDPLLERARADGFANLRAIARDDCPEGLRFAMQRGFTNEAHTYESVLDIATFDECRFAGQIEAIEARGIRFFSFADTVGGEEAKRRLWEVNTFASVGQPGYDVAQARGYERFAEDVFDGSWFRPDGQIFAANGDRWIGMATVGETAPREMYNMVTAVYPEYRNRGIATALKLLAVRFCRKHNARIMRTNNRSENAPMLAINRKLGYRPEPGYYTLRRIIVPH